MTTKQIAESVGKDERSVRRWINKASDKMSGCADKMSDAEKTKKPVDWTLDETIAIIETGMGKSAAQIYRMNAEKSTTEIAVNDDETLRDAFRLMAQAFNTIAETQRNIDSRVRIIEGAIESRKALLPAPSIKPRDHVNMLVRNHATKARIEFKDAWKELYQQFGYRTNSNPSVSAKNRGMPVLDYLDAEGMIETLEAVAIEVFGGAR